MAGEGMVGYLPGESPAFRLERTGESMRTIAMLGVVILGALALRADAALYPAAVMADNPVLYYRLDESSGTVANDAAPLGGTQNGTYTGGYTLNQAGALTGNNPSNSAAKFATNGYIDSTFVFAPTSAYTVEFWVNFATLNAGDDQTILSQENSGGTGRDIVYWHNATQKMASAPNGLNNDWSSSASVTAGQYTMVDLVYNGAGTWTWYKNGAANGTFSAVSTASSGTIKIAVHKGATTAFLNGTLDEFAIYDTALTGTQISAHFDAASAAPEPSSIGAIALTACAAATSRRRRSSAAA